MVATDWHDLRVDVTGADESVQIDVGGELDMTSAPRLIAAVRDQVSPGVRDVEMNCNGIDFVDSAGIRALIVCRNEAQAKGASFAVVEPSRSLERVLDMTGLTSLLAPAN